MKYVTSDIHGRLDRLKRLIEVIQLSENDTLYIIGDLVDRGSEPIETIEFVMNHPQIEVIMGNHDEMFLHSLKYEDEVQIERWGRNGCSPTIDGFFKRTIEEQDRILDYIDSLPYFKIIDNRYLLVHAGFEPVRLFTDMENVCLEDALNAQKDRLVWVREDFIKNKALDNLITIFGHSPRRYIDKCFDREAKLPYEIWFDDIYKDKIGIDTGNCYDGGRMACLRLDDHKTFYIE